MGINVNISTATTPGLLEVEQPDVTGSWDNPMTMVECVWGFSNQLTYGDYDEVTIGGYFDICIGLLLEVVLGATVEVISPLAVEIIYPIDPLQPLLAAIGSGPAKAAAGAAGWAGRSEPQGGKQPGLQYDVVFGNYLESVTHLKFEQHGGDKFDSAWVKAVVAETYTVNLPAADLQEFIGADVGYEAADGTTKTLSAPASAKTLVSNSSITLTATSGPLLFISGQLGVASSAAAVEISSPTGGLAIANNGVGQTNLSAVGTLSLTGGDAQVQIGGGAIRITPSAQQTLSAAGGVGAGSAPVIPPPVSLAAAIVAQAQAAADAATAWAANAQAQMAAEQAWNPGGPAP